MMCEYSVLKMESQFYNGRHVKKKGGTGFSNGLQFRGKKQIRRLKGKTFTCFGEPSSSFINSIALRANTRFVCQISLIGMQQ